jgi:hypothetical protein
MSTDDDQSTSRDQLRGYSVRGAWIDELAQIFDVPAEMLPSTHDNAEREQERILAFEAAMTEAAASTDQPPADLVDRIQTLIDEASPFDGHCMRCGDPLDPDGPSPLYCREQCADAYAEQRTAEGFREHWAPDDPRIQAEKDSPLAARRNRERAANVWISAEDNATHRVRQARRALLLHGGPVPPAPATYLVITAAGGVLLWDVERPPSARELPRGCTVLKLVDVPADLVVEHIRRYNFGIEPALRSSNDCWHSALVGHCGCAVCRIEETARAWLRRGRNAPRWRPLA